MKKAFGLFLALFLAISLVQGQESYQASETKYFGLIHTKLDLTPDWLANQLIGKAELTLKPWFYPQDTLILDAKGFDINSLKVNGETANFNYDLKKITIPLGRLYLADEKVKVEISYVAKPDDLKNIPGLPHPEKKGLYFIKPAKNKPQQVWTEGETEYNSCWFPTIDSPNQKHTQEISLTVKSEFLTLSNGLLKSSKNNDDGTKTETWVHDIPHSVYLTMIAAGPFKKVVDSTFEEFEVSYYVEPEYEEEAVNIFGRTPEMIGYFQELLGTKYPWQKYSQIAVRDYVSGAMENTTATVHGNSVQKNANQLVDENDDGVMAHELFHHWFGDLVTAESWANLPLNESFADYSEYLWASHKYGKDEGDWVNFIGLNEYLNESDSKQAEMIRYRYTDKEDMFDAHSYAKGGRILHMLRIEIGDKAFFASLKLYLDKNKFQNAEIHNLRMAVEEITGKDYNGFFDQWFLRAGHPRFHMEHSYENGILKIDLNQQLDSINNWVYTVPLTLEIGTSTGKAERKIWIDEEIESYIIPMPEEPKYVLADPEGYFLGVLDQVQSEEELYDQFASSEALVARLNAFNKLTNDEAAEENELAPNLMYDAKKRALALKGLEDKSWRIREIAAQKFFNYDGEDFLKVEKALQSLIATDEKSQVRAASILAMKNFLNPQNDLLFRKALADTSYMVRAAALEAILINNPPDADSLSASMEDIKDVNIFSAVAGYKASLANPADFDWFIERMGQLSGLEVYQTMGIFGSYLVSSDANTQFHSIPFLKEIAINESTWFGRFSATQALMLLTEHQEAKDALKVIFAMEKEEQLQQIYKQIPLD